MASMAGTLEEFETERLVVRELSEDDLAAIFDV